MNLKYQLKKWERLKKEASTALDNAEEQRLKLAANCEHPAEYVKIHYWEHDNGYGIQTQIAGKRCSICRQEDNWNNNRWY